MTEALTKKILDPSFFIYSVLQTSRQSYARYEWLAIKNTLELRLLEPLLALSDPRIVFCISFERVVMVSFTYETLGLKIENFPFRLIGYLFVVFLYFNIMLRRCPRN